MMKRFLYALRILGLTAKNFISDDCLRHSAALSFYTLFSLAPMVMMSVHVASLFAAEVDFKKQMVQQFSQLVGSQGAEGISLLLDNLKGGQSSRFQLSIGAIVLLFSATSIFVQLQEAFNQIFSVVASGRSIIKKIMDRVISLGIILSLGLIMILSLVLDSSIALLQTWLAGAFPDVAVFFITLLQYLGLALLGTMEIYALLHFLPDVHLPRHYKLRGCAVITLLLVCGKSAISWYIGTSRFGQLGGASASVIVLMMWIYYSSMIVFFGTEMIKTMAVADEVALRPRRYAVKVKSVVAEENPVAPEKMSADHAYVNALPGQTVAEAGQENPDKKPPDDLHA